MNKLTQLLVAACLLFSSYGHAQRDYNIYLRSGVLSVEKRQPARSWSRSQLHEKRFGDHFYLILQFDDILTAAQQKKLTGSGVQLVSYLPNYAYWAKVSVAADLDQLPVRAVIPPRWSYKLPASLASRRQVAKVPDGDLNIRVFPFPGIDPAVLSEELQKLGAVELTTTGRYVEVNLQPNQLSVIADHPGVLYAEPKPPAPVPEDLSALSLHGFHALSTASQQDLDGSGVVVSVADDGIVAHPDFKNRVVHHTTRDHPDHHGDMVLGILSGAGNIDPMMTGMAPGALIHLFDILEYQHIREAVENYEAYGATITSTSYGEGCGGKYDANAQSIDDQTYRHPYLLHFFSAGNDAAGSCSETYGEIIDQDGYRFGNITGGRKAAKNVIAVGNLFYNDQLVTLSSRGPAEDGRIKPDLCAFGQGQKSTYPEHDYQPAGGASAAVPVVTGAAAMLSQLYREEQAGAVPPSALLKAALLNTAEDLGRPGPDFIYGWGSVRVNRAAEIIRQKQYIKASVEHQQEAIHQITIPHNAADLRVMIYWHDPAAHPTAGKALINDLDLAVQPAAAGAVRPLVLSTSAHLDSINKPAYPGVDRVNNVEQVSIAHPKGGTYHIRVKGHLVPQGPQSYYIVYSYRTRPLRLVYPLGGESFVPGEQQTIRWEAFGTEAPFHLEYRLAGQDWQTMANNVDPHLRHFNWHVPGQLRGNLEIRVRAGEHEDLTSTPVHVLGQPTFNFAYESENAAWIYWSPVEGADSFDIYVLGDRYMEKIGATHENRFLLETTTGQVDWYSVRARGADGLAGRRAVAKRYHHYACETTVHLKIQFDTYPRETRWQLVNQAGEIVVSGGPYKEASPNSRFEKSYCIPRDCYEFIMLDSYGDGLCAIEQNPGFYQLTDADGKVLAQGNCYEQEDRTSFCLGTPQEPPPPLPPLTITVVELRNISCHGQNDGRIVVQADGGQGTYEYQWSNGQSGPAIDQLGGGRYQVTVSDGLSSVVETIRISEPTPLTAAADAAPENCETGSPGTATAQATGGVPPYRYDWSSGHTKSTATGLSPGAYTLTVTDANGCQATSSTVVEAVTDIQIDFTPHQPRCPGDANGRILTEVTGGKPPYDYRWSTGDSTMAITQLLPGEYSLTITDANGCRAFRQTSLSAPVPVRIEADVRPATDLSLGSIDLQVSGGRPGYRYQWADGPITAQRNDLMPGEYTVNVTDFLGCAASQSFTVSDETSGNALTYCPATGLDAGQEWIEATAVNQTWFVSGNNEGYRSYVDQPVAIATGQPFRLELQLGYLGGAAMQYWSVWIDFNQNGRLDDDGELVFQSSAPKTSYQVEIDVPADLSGSTRMRVAMQWGAHPEVCEDVVWGEIEDYTLNFVAPEYQTESMGATLPAARYEQPGIPVPALRIYPNPAIGFFQLAFRALPVGAGQLRLVNNLGQPIKAWPWRAESQRGTRRFTLPPGLPPGFYHLRLQIGEWYQSERLSVR